MDDRTQDRLPANWPLIRTRSDIGTPREAIATGRPAASGTRRVKDLRCALQWLFVGVRWSVIGFRRDCTWTPQLLSSAALLWAWSEESTLVERFHTARKVALWLFPSPGDPATSCQAFMKRLRKGPVHGSWCSARRCGEGWNRRRPPVGRWAGSRGLASMAAGWICRQPLPTTTRRDAGEQNLKKG